MRRHLVKKLKARKKTGAKLTRLQNSALDNRIRLTAKEVSLADSQIELVEGPDPWEAVVEKRKDQIRAEL